ncbi:MAG: thiamine-phosphate kinase [Opitutus sp.]
MHPFTRRKSESVAALGEAKLILEIRRWLGNVSPRAPFGIGDDCAVLPPSKGPQLITVDPVIYPRHFNDRVRPRDVGSKLLKRNLSDLAAMGGRPTAAVLALTLSPTVRLSWLKEFYLGLAASARRYSVRIVGGDIAQADSTLAASLTLLGEATGPRTLTRTGAKVGDHIYVTGALGDSLRTGHHHAFMPRLKEGVWLARRPEIVAMMDVSDGIAKDLRCLTPRGSTAALIGESIPRRGRATLRAALTDGEDYELLLIVSGSSRTTAFEGAWKTKFPKLPLTRIGEFVKGRRVPAGTLDLSQFSGYEHLM